MRVRFSMFGEDLINRSFDRKIEALEDMRPAWDDFADMFQAIEREQFDTEGTSGGETWSPLSQPYGLWKAAHYPGQPIMRREDDLYKSLSNQPFGVDRREPDQMWLGTSVEYAIYHQKGQGVPQRKIVVFTEEMKRDLVKIIQRHVMGAAR